MMSIPIHHIAILSTISYQPPSPAPVPKEFWIPSGASNGSVAELSVAGCEAAWGERCDENWEFIIEKHRDFTMKTGIQS